MEKKKYETPDMEITKFETEDVITASGNTNTSGEPDEGGIY